MSIEGIDGISSAPLIVGSPEKPGKFDDRSLAALKEKGCSRSGKFVFIHTTSGGKGYSKVLMELL